MLQAGHNKTHWTTTAPMILRLAAQAHQKTFYF
jgi:hypothetical protein